MDYPRAGTYSRCGSPLRHAGDYIGILANALSPDEHVGPLRTDENELEGQEQVEQLRSLQAFRSKAMEDEPLHFLEALFNSQIP